MAEHIDNWVTIELIGTQAGQIVETVFPYKSGDMAISQGDLQAFVNGWVNTMLPLLQNCLSVAFIFQSAIAKTHFLQFPNVEADYTFSGATTGLITGDATPGNVTLAVKALTGVIGRSRRGRQFMPGIAEQHTLLNSVVSGYMTNVLALFARNLTGFSYVNHLYVPGVASRKNAFINTVVSYGADYLIDSMRRRLTGRGR